MAKKFKKHYIIEVSLDELMERAKQRGDSVHLEYQLGAYYEMDTPTIGEMAHIQKLIKDGLLSPCEKEALFKKLDDHVLDTAERKAYQRAVEKLREALLQ
jgi:hypothetical protein